MMKMNHLQYVWNNQTKDIWEVASDLKENAMQVDVYLQGIEDKGRVNDTSGHHKRSVLPAHRLMLAASSPFLNKILSEHYAEHHDTCVNVIVPDVSHETLLHILDFIYCGRTLENISSSVRKDVVEAAKLLQISGMVNYFQPNSSLLDKKSKDRSIKVEEREDSLEAIKVPPKKRGRKRKVLSQQSKIDGDLHVISNIIKEEAVDGMALSESEDVRYGRCRRRIKSRYSSDIYEVSLPKKRCVAGKGFDVLVKKEEGNQEQNKEISHSSGAENLHTYALKLSSENMCVNPSSFHNTNDNDDEKRFEKLIEFATPETDHVLDLRATKQDHLQPELVSLPQTQSSSTSTVSSVVIPNLFSTDTSYLQEPTEISCASFIDSSASIPTIPKQHFQASPLTVATSSSVISQIGDLTVVSAPPLTRGPLQKYVPEMCKPHEMSNLHDDDDDEEPEEEDGLFKLQVLLKDCEDFPEAVTHHVNHPLRCPTGEDTQVRFEEPTDGLDIRQWISEEINSSTMPKMHSHLSAVLAEDHNSQGDVTSSTSTAQISDYKEQQEDIQQDFDNGKVNNKAGESLDVTENEAIGKSGSREETPENNAYEDEEKATYECNICGKVYPSLQRRKTHLKNFHKEANQMCKHCGKMFTRRCDLYCHERRHNDANLPCNVCGKVFKLNKDLVAHMKIHSGGKHYSCTRCKKELTSFRNLRNHIANVHQKKRSHACHMCNKTYAKSMALQVHVRSVHTGERPFKCKTCSKAFCNPYLLKIHEVGHTGEQKYSCKVCQRRFSQYCNMINHQRVHSNEKPFMCDICKKRSFKSRESLRKHKWSHTGLKPLRCPHCSKEYRIKESFERHMLKCHDEVVHLPQISFEFSEKMTVENTKNEMHRNTRKTVRNINDSVVVETPRIELTDAISKLEDHKTLGATLPENIVPVVQFVSDISPRRTTSIELDANDTEQLHLHSDDIEISYPMLSTNPSQDDGDSTTLTTITDQISSDTDISHPIESLLHVTIPGTNSSVIMTEDGKVNILLDC